jgi:Fe-S-cluster containining protein
MKDNFEKVNISESLGSLIANMDEAQHQIVNDMFGHYASQYRGLRDHNSAIDVIAAIHNTVDEAINELVKSDLGDHSISCGKGCSFCCYQSVDICDDEAEILLEYAEEKGIEIDYKYLEKQAAFSFEDFKRLSIDERKCVFLDDKGECGVYDHRPINCRKLVVVTDPSLCDMDENAGAQIGKIASVEAEVVSASVLHVRESGAMPSMLLKVRKNA